MGRIRLASLIHSKYLNTAAMNNNQPENHNDEIVTLIPQSSQRNHLDSYDEETYAIYESSRPTYIQDKPLWLETLLTPWGFASILLVLLSNSLLSWATWSNSYVRQASVPVVSSGIAQSPIPAQASVPQTTTPSVSSPTVAVPPQPVMKTSVPPVPPAPPAIVNIPHPPAKPKTDLTSALLPPSARPQFVQVRTISKPSAPTVAAKKTASKSVKKATVATRKTTKPPTVAQITTLPPPPPTQPVSIQLPTSNADPSKVKVANERLLEEARLREAAKTNMTFFQKTKAQREALQTRQNLNQALEQSAQPQHPTQTEAQPQPRAIPNTLIIDGNNPENNTNR